MNKYDTGPYKKLLQYILKPYRNLCFHLHKRGQNHNKESQNNIPSPHDILLCKVNS